jgi:hypothetical protein
LFDSAFYFLKLAYRVSPNDPLVNKTAYQFYSRAGLPDLAEKFAQKAVEEDPLSSLHLSALAYYQLLNGKSAMAKASLMKVLELDSANLFAYVRLRDLAIVARDRKALETINRNLEKSKTMGSHDLERSIRGQLLAFNGHKQEALKLQTSRYEALQVFYLLNDQNEMLTNLDSMNAENSAPSYVDLENNALYNGIRQDSRFKKTLLVARERDQARRKKYERLDEDY